MTTVIHCHPSVAGRAAAAVAGTAGGPPDLAAVKARQRTAWASGDYAVIGTTLQIVGETLCEAVDLRAGERVLDVAAANGNCSLAAARRGASARWSPPTTFRPCSNAAARAPRPTACRRSSSRPPTPRRCPSRTGVSTWRSPPSA